MRVLLGRLSTYTTISSPLSSSNSMVRMYILATLLSVNSLDDGNNRPGSDAMEEGDRALAKVGECGLKGWEWVWEWSRWWWWCFLFSTTDQPSS